MQSNKEGLRAIFFKKGEKGKGLQFPVHWIIGAGSSALAAVTWHSCDWVWKLNVGFPDSHCKVSSSVYTGQHQCAEFVSYLLHGGFAVVDICL